MRLLDQEFDRCGICRDEYDIEDLHDWFYIGDAVVRLKWFNFEPYICEQCAEDLNVEMECYIEEYIKKMVKQ